jgi:6-phosphofructokinase 1
MAVKGKIGVLVGGGPAPGLNGVISAVTIEAINNGLEVLGFQDGFKWLAKGDTTHHRVLTIDTATQIALKGGSILGTSRANPTKSEEHMANVLRVLHELGITCLVTIGGDDTAFSSSQVCKRANGAIRTVHVPKTIDNDLTLPGNAPTFGFETARHIGTYLVRNLAEDAKTTSRWYLIVSMGRTAGHLALGLGKAAAATLTLIPEEFRGRRFSFDELCEIIVGSIIKRRASGSHYGVVVLAEGLLEAMDPETVKAAVNSGKSGYYGRIELDEHGHLRMAEIEFGHMIKDLLTQKLKALGLDVAFVQKDIGYELRCADPIPFDAEYTRDLGYSAVKYVLSDAAAQTGAVVSFVEGKMRPLPFDEMLDPKTGKMKLRRVNVDGEVYECARRYMIRLERADFEDPHRLAKLAAVVKLTPDEFKARFGRIGGL